MSPSAYAMESEANDSLRESLGDLRTQLARAKELQAGAENQAAYFLRKAEKAEAREADVHISWSQMFDRAIAAESRAQAARADAIEECARVCDAEERGWDDALQLLRARQAAVCANLIRALASKPAGDK